jgi:hypothetical protein
VPLLSYSSAMIANTASDSGASRFEGPEASAAEEPGTGRKWDASSFCCAADSYEMRVNIA